MSIIKRPYEISVWEDVYSGTETEISSIDYTSNSISAPTNNTYKLGTYLQERKIAVIGGDSFQHQGRICEPNYNIDIKNKTILTFSIYRKYYDNKTGELTDNPFYRYITNERKIKLKYDDGIVEDKWHDFIITDINEDSSNYKTSVTATDAAVVELSKIGFNKTFNSELQNNTNTIDNLAKTALNETVWQLDENKTETIKQYQLDNLIRIELPFVLNSSNVAVPLQIQLYPNDDFNNNSIITLEEDSVIYLFYSQIASGAENNDKISLLFLADDISGTNWTTREATNKDFIDNILQKAYFGTLDVSNYDWTKTIVKLNFPSFFHKNGTDILYTKKGRRLIQNQISHYDKLLNRYVKNYTKIANTDTLVTLHTIPNSREGSPHTKAYLLPTTTQPDNKQIIFGHFQVVYGFLSELQNKGDKNQCLHFLFLTNNINSETISTSSISNSSNINNGYLCTINLKGQNPAWQEKEITYNSNTYTVYVPYTYCYNENPTITNYTAPCESDLVYGYEEDEYNVQPLVQNLLANTETATTLDGWALCEEEKLRVTRLGLGMARKESSEPDYPFMQIGVYLNANNMFRGNTDYILDYDIDHGNNKTHHLQTSYTRFANFITNSCITDNAAVIGTLQPGDKFRLKLNVERNITDFSSISTTSITGVHDNLNVLRGLHPYIVKLPNNKTVTDFLTDITLLKSDITRTRDTNDSWKKYFKISGNIAPITFGYLPYDSFRNFDCDRAYYIKYKSNGTADKIVSDLRLFGNTSLVPIYKSPSSGNMQYNGPIFFVPYWRLFELMGMQGNVSYIEPHPDSQAKDGDNDTYDSTAIYLLNSRGEQAFLDYWNGDSSKFTFLDFCVICDINDCLQRDGNDNLVWKSNAGKTYPSYYVTFTDQTTFLSPGHSGKNFENFTNLMSNCEYYQCIDSTNGYFNKLNKKNGTIILKNDDNSATSIQADDIVAILSLRDTWNLIKYMPYVSGEDSHCTFETVGTYNGIPLSITGDETLIYASSDKPLRLETKYNNTSLTKEDILGYNDYGQFCFLFSYYASWASNESVTSGGYMNLSLSHLQLIRYYEDENGNVIEPDTIPAASTRKIYYYFSPDYGYGSIDNIEKPEQILYLSKSYTPLNSVTPVINNTGEAYQSITTTESNVFNILQKLSEVFECWLNIEIVHDETGAVALIDGKPQKFIYFTKYINDIRNYGYTYGLNLNSTQRHVITDDIVTKMIVKANSNEFGIDKYTTIARSKYNVLGGTTIFNFDYFINKQLLPSNIYEVLYDIYGKPLDLIGKQINANTQKLQQLAVEIAQIDSERQFYQEQNKAATNEITLYQKNFQTLTGRSYSYYLANKTSLTNIWNQDGLISLFLEYIEKIQYFTGVRKTSDLLYKEREQAYKNKYAEYNNIVDRNAILTAHRSKIMEEFYNIYHAYIREGSWISEDYLDDDKYFFAAQDVLNTSAQPKVTYTFNVVDIGALEEFKGYNFKLGDKTFIEDPEFFGYEEDGITPYKEEIIISGMQINLDSPEKNTITVQNYRTQFQDLFQRIAATVQAVEYHTGNYRNTKTERP